LHVYLTVPFVMSWSLLQAMSAECAIVASATVPVEEAIDDGTHGLLAPFYDVSALTDRAIKVLESPKLARELGHAARARVLERYRQRDCLAQLASFFERVAKNGRGEHIH